jgi:hypothetical protein
MRLHSIDIARTFGFAAFAAGVLRSEAILAAVGGTTICAAFGIAFGAATNQFTESSIVFQRHT